jgi:UDP-glucose 4-epimerase
LSRTAHIFGATGFVGGKLAERLLKDGFDVVALGRSPRETVRDPALRGSYRVWDPADTSFISGAGPEDVVFHLAADVNVRASLKAPEAMIQRNTALTLAILRSVRDAGTKPLVVYLSSDRVYGDAAGCLTEDTVPTPIDPYGASKLASEHFVRAYSASFEVPATVLRSANLYGPQQRPIQFIPSMVRKVLDGADTITLGDLSGARNFLYVDDLTDACARVVNEAHRKEAFELFNVCGKVHPLTNVCETIKRQTLKHLDRHIEFVSEASLRRAPGSQLGDAAVSSARFGDHFDWTPQIPLEEGIARTIQQGVGEAEVPS